MVATVGQTILAVDHVVSIGCQFPVYLCWCLCLFTVEEAVKGVRYDLKLTLSDDNYSEVS